MNCYYQAKSSQQSFLHLEATSTFSICILLILNWNITTIKAPTKLTERDCINNQWQLLICRRSVKSVYNSECNSQQKTSISPMTSLLLSISIIQSLFSLLYSFELISPDASLFLRICSAVWFLQFFPLSIHHITAKKAQLSKDDISTQINSKIIAHHRACSICHFSSSPAESIIFSTISIFLK